MLRKIKEYYNDTFRGLSPLAVLKQAWHDCKAWFIDNRQKLHNLTQTNLDLAAYHFHNGDSSDTIFRLQLLKLFGSFPPAAHYYMGRCYMEKFKTDKAKQYLMSYKQSGDNQFTIEATYCLSVLEKHADIHDIPLSIVTHNFDKAAKHQKNLLTVEKKGNASLPKQVYDILIKYLTDSERSLTKNVLDLGCGTGALGQHLRQARMANSIVGVDVSSKMLDIAQALQYDGMKTYSRLVRQDVREFFAKSKDYNIYDVVIASDLITYFRDIAFLLEQIDRFSTPDSVVMLSFKNTKIDQKFMHSIEEFHYSKQYVQTVVADTMWELKMAQEVSIKSSSDMTILLLVKKTTPSGLST